MKLPSVKNLKVAGKKVLLRTNYDVPLEKGKIGDDSRIVESLETINYLLQKKAKIIIISHLGRPKGRAVADLSLKPVVKYLAKLLSRKVPLVEKTANGRREAEVVMLENLRFSSGEEANEKKFAQKLAKQADFYVNDAFACSHRQHASIVSVPQFLPSALGLDFLEEVEVLVKVQKTPQRPIVIIFGGVKKSKTEAVKKLTAWADYILIGGQVVNYDGISQMIKQDPKILGSLIRQGEDITMETIKKFKKIIAQAKTIVWTGPMGAFENQKFEKGTKEIAQAVVASGAYTVAGGGDTEAALTKFDLVDKVDYISSGGGAMLTFLADGTLPGIEAIRRKK